MRRSVSSSILLAELRQGMLLLGVLLLPHVARPGFGLATGQENVSVGIGGATQRVDLRGRRGVGIQFHVTLHVKCHVTFHVADRRQAPGSQVTCNSSTL